MSIIVDGETREVLEGRSIASVLVELRVAPWGVNEVSGAVRAPFCGIGMCLECELVVDGRPGVKACTTGVRDAMRIETGASLEGRPADG